MAQPSGPHSCPSAPVASTSIFGLRLRPRLLEHLA